MFTQHENEVFKAEYTTILEVLCEQTAKGSLPTSMAAVWARDSYRPAVWVQGSLRTLSAHTVIA